MWNLSIPEWGDVFSGQTLSTTRYSGYRSNPEDIKLWMRYFSQSPTAAQVLQATEYADEFFAIEEDLSLLIPKKQQEECFFSLKNGFTAPNCPAQFIYFARQIFKMYGICNLIGPALPRDVKAKVIKQDYFGAGYTAVDAICNFVWKDYKPIKSGRPLSMCGDWYEMYIPATELVAALPLEMGRHLSVSDSPNISLQPGIGLMLGDVPLYTLPGSVGVTASYYDLRRPI